MKPLQALLCFFGRHGSNVVSVDRNQAFQHFRCEACRREWTVDVPSVPSNESRAPAERPPAQLHLLAVHLVKRG